MCTRASASGAGGCRPPVLAPAERALQSGSPCGLLVACAMLEGLPPPPPGVGHKGPRCPGLQRAGGGLCLPPHWNPHPPGHDPRHDVRPRVRTTRGIGFAPSCTRLGVFSPHWVRPGQVQTLPGRNRNSSHTLGRAVRWAVSCGATPHGPWTSQEGSEQRSPFGRNPMRTPPARCARCRGRFPPPGTYPLRYLPP